MRSCIPVLLLTGLSFTASSWGAGVLGQIIVDLDRDGKPEVVEVRSARAKEAHRSRLVVSVTKSRYETDYFSADGDRPDIQVRQLDRKSGLIGLLLTTDEAGSCVQHLLTYVKGRLRLLFKQDAGPSCQSLATYGDLRFAVSTWEGFWTKVETFRIDPDGTSARRIDRTDYSVNTTGYAGIDLELDGATCEHRKIAPGTYLTIKTFDSRTSRYLIETPDGACGWIPSSELTSNSSKIQGLPWAG